MVVIMYNRYEIAHEFAEAIKSEYILKIVLFGSVARGDDSLHSDIDILIVSNYRDEIWPKIRKEIAKIIIEKQQIVSAHVLSEDYIKEINDFTFMKNIRKEGVIIG